MSQTTITTIKLTVLIKLIVVAIAGTVAPIAMLILGPPCLFGWLSVFGGVPPGRTRFMLLATIYLLAGCIMTFGWVIDVLPFKCWEGWLVILSMLFLIGVPMDFMCRLCIGKPARNQANDTTALVVRDGKIYDAEIVE